MSSVRVKNLNYYYPGQDQAVLHDLCFEAQAPNMLSILGGNLAGKTTLANLMIRQHLGQIIGTLSGSIELTLPPTGRGLIGFLFEDVNWMFCNIHVDEEVAFGLENLGVPSSTIRACVSEALRSTGLLGFERRQINTLSGGELQKLAIAAVLVITPGILVTDDLLSNLDVPSSATLPELIHEYRRRSGCLWIDLARRWTNHVSEADRIAVLRKGVLTDTRSPHALIQKANWSPFEADEVLLPEPVEILLRANNTLGAQGLEPISPTLDRENLLSRLHGRFRVRGRRPIITSLSRCPSELEIKNVAFAYTSSAPLLKECTVSFTSGRINILAGRNGSGKTTLAKLSAGLVKPNRGAILWRGDYADTRTLRRNVCLVFQNPEYQFLADTVSGELYLTGRLLSLPHEKTRKLVDGLLAMLALDAKADLSPYGLTTGEKRRLAIGIALARNADVIIVDEPTLGQDKIHTVALGALFKQLTSAGKTLILVSHDSRFIFEYGDVIHLLEGGQVTYSGLVPHVFEPSTTFDFAGQSDVLNLWRLIQGGSHPIADVPRSVDELFASIEVVRGRN